MINNDYDTFSSKACKELKEITSNVLLILNNLSKDEHYFKIIDAVINVTEENRFEFAFFVGFLSTKNAISDVFAKYDVNINSISNVDKLLEKPSDWNTKKEKEIFNSSLYYTFDDEMLDNVITSFEVLLYESQIIRDNLIREDGYNLVDELDDIIIKNYSTLYSDFSEENEVSEEELETEKPFDFNKLGYFIDGSKYKEAPAICREKEIKEVVLSLLSPEKSVILTGPAGVGKTAIAEQIAYLIANKKIHKRLENKKIFALDVASLTAGCKYVGELEKKVTSLVTELKKNPDIIVFVDEIHTIIGAGKSEGSQLDVSNILKGPISRGEIRIIGATTEEEYNRYFAGKVYDPNLPIKDQNRSFGGDKAFKDRFEKVSVGEPDIETMRFIIGHLLEKYSKDYDLPVGLVGAEINALTLFLATFTSSQYRSDQTPSNPRFVSHLLGTAFANSIYDYKDKLTLSDLALALYKSDLKFEPKDKRYLAKELIDLVTHYGIEEEKIKLKK